MRVPSRAPRRPRAKFDGESGYWLVPMNDSDLALHMRGWSPHVQLRAQPDAIGDGYELRVRSARRPSAHAIVLELAREGKIAGSPAAAEAVVAKMLGERV